MIPKYQNLKTLYQWVKTRMIGKSEQYRKVRIVRTFEIKLGNILTVLVDSVVLIMSEQSDRPWVSGYASVVVIQNDTPEVACGELEVNHLSVQIFVKQKYFAIATSNFILQSLIFLLIGKTQETWIKSSWNLNFMIKINDIGYFAVITTSLNICIHSNPLKNAMYFRSVTAKQLCK